MKYEWFAQISNAKYIISEGIWVNGICDSKALFLKTLQLNGSSQRIHSSHLLIKRSTHSSL